MQNEPGVISIFPMQTKENPNLIRIIEIYSNKEVYDAHIASTHFQKYKTSTPHMIKDLKLVDMDMLAPENLGLIFKRNQLMAKEWKTDRGEWTTMIFIGYIPQSLLGAISHCIEVVQ